MKLGKKIAAASMAAALAVTMTMPSFAYGETSESSTLTSDTQKVSEYQTWKSEVWDTGARANSANIVMTPGATAKDLNFAWYSEAKGAPAVRVSTSADMSNAKVFDGEALDINRKNTSEKVYKAANHVSITGFFEENTTYYYQYNDDKANTKGWSKTKTYTTKSTDSFQTILVGDPQIGASGSSTQGQADDLNIATDTFNWNKTLEQAMKTAGNASFILSAGDQIDYSSADEADTKGVREAEYAGFLYPDALREMPLATTIGNHESKGTDYQYHYNNPNSEDNLGATKSGSDYYFSYGDVLFISLNSNNRNVSEHRALMQKAVDSHKDAKWKVVMFHHDIYGSGQPHSGTDGANLRVLFAPLMDEFDIDVCLTGHDHSYARTFQMIDGKAINYGDNVAADPEGTLYIAAGSASGSKFYELAATKQYYIAERNNAQRPTFSTIDFTSNSMTIKTYDYNGDKYAHDFTITKDVDEASLLELVNQAETMDTSAYTSGTVAAMDTAVEAVKTLLESEEDTGAAKLEESYNAELNTDSTTDPLNYYGYAQDLTGSVGVNYKRNGTRTLKEGFSTLLDKTLNNDQQLVEVSDIDSAYASLATAIDNLAKTSDAEQLDKAVADAQNKYDNAVEGTEVGQYKEGAKAALKTAIDAAKTVADNDAATASKIAKALSDLQAAVKAFDAAKVTETVTPAPDDNNSQKPDDNNNSQVPGDDDSQAPSENDGSNPNTGDHTSMGVVAGLAALCVVSGGTVIYLRKRSHKSEQ